MRRKRVLLGTVGGLLTLVAGLAVARPGLVLGVDPLAQPVRAVSSIETGTLLLGGSALVGLYVAWAARSATADRLLDEETTVDERFERIEVRPPERVTADERTLSASDLDETVAFAVAGDGAAFDRVRRRLRSLAAARLSRTDPSADGVAGSSDSERGAAAAEVIAAGAWTDDRTAAAFLADGDDGPAHPLLSRLRLWLDPDAERQRRIRRTVAAVDALGGDGR